MPRTIWGFEEERNPTGETGLLKSDRDVQEVRAARVASHPWFLILWEPLTTKVPGPHLVQPWGCYIRTTIFYARGYIKDPFSRLWRSRWKWHVSPPNTKFLEWDRVDHALTFDDWVEFDGEVFIVGAGKIRYKNKRWWICHWARRKRED